MTDLSAITGDLYDLSNGWTNEDFKVKYDGITDDTVIPFLAQAGLSPDDGPIEGDQIEDWTDAAQAVLSWLCMKDERIEKTLFAALHDHIRCLDGVRSQISGEKMYLVCKNCGEAFDDMQFALEHGTSDPQSGVWCGESGFDMMPESEAL
jgi:hypothetical protein